MMEMQTQFFITMGLMLASGGLGYYAGGRKLAGIKVDLDNTKAEIEKVKDFVNSKRTKIVTPVSNTKATNTGTVITTPSI